MLCQLLTFVRGDIIQNTMSPLPPGALRDRIEDLTAGVGFPLDRIFVYEGRLQTTVLYSARITGGGRPAPLVLRRAPLDATKKWGWRGPGLCPLSSVCFYLQSILMCRITFCD